MPLPHVNTGHLRRYKDVVSLLIKYGQKDALRDAGLSELLGGSGQSGARAGEEFDGIVTGVDVNEAEADFSPTSGSDIGSVAGSAGAPPAGSSGSKVSAGGQRVAPNADIVADLERLGPAFVLLGKLLAARTDILPPSYTEPLSHIDEHSDSMPMSQIEAVLKAEFRSPNLSMFAKIVPEPISKSTISQIHRAQLRDGRQVVLKVQRPGIREKILDDIEAFDEMARFCDDHLRKGKHFHDMVEEFRRVVLAELDFRQEAHNLRAFDDHLSSLDKLIVPKPIESYTTSRVLTMSFIEGQKIDGKPLYGLLHSEKTKLAEQMLFAYLQQIFTDGFVHADASADNLLLTPDAKLALMSVGVVARIAPSTQDRLLQLCLAINTGKTEHVADLVIGFGEPQDTFDEQRFRRDVSEVVLIHRDMNVEQIELGRVFQNLAKAAAQNGLILPSELAMLGTSLVNLDHVAKAIDPKFPVNDFLKKNLGEMVKRRMAKTLSPSNFFHGIIESMDLIEKLPGKVGKILDSVANNDLTVTVHAIDEKVLVGGFQKVANRIAVALVLASLIIGASMLMNIKTRFTLFGYPGLAIICFILAAGCGFALVLEILITDHREK